MIELIRKRKENEIERLLHAPIFSAEEEIPNDLVDFCDMPLYRREYEALKEVYALVGTTPEEEYRTTLRIKIAKNHVCKLYLADKDLPSLPESVGNWNDLREISFRCCQLESLPESVGNWTTLQRIALEFNKLESLPDSIENWKNLKRIDIYENPIAKNEEYIAELQRKLPNANIITK